MKETLMAGFTGKGYQDVRYEYLEEVAIEYQGENLKDISVSKKEGGHARGFYQGGWGHESFNNLEDVKEAIQTAISRADVAAKYREDSYKLAKAPVIEDKVVADPEINAKDISLEEKRELVKKYNEMILEVEGITTTKASYYEINSHKYIATNEGTYIDQEEPICGIRFLIYAKKGDVMQSIRASLGGSGDYKLLLNGEDKLMDAVEKVKQMVDAEPVKAGNYPVIMDPSAAGVFIHEAFGHLSEADGVADSPELRETMKLGREFGKTILNVIDDGSVMGHPGSIIYDDEGVPAKKTYLIKDGKLTGRLHSRETAGLMDEELSGNCRAKDFTFNPVVRMSNIYIGEGDSTFEEMVSSIDDGLYLIGAAGGQTSGNTFTLGTAYGYRIKDGEIKEMVRDIVINCNLFETMARISMIGKDLTFSRAGGCGKAGQILIKSGKGAPHIKIDSITVAGK